ncbi:GntR family transcriptional regulator [Vibrio sp. SCSIO 43136]|uniref:GntR family transcriptional regulator n=1 Tax=Vibrio sp. SCSIO 43136 TaxID=2819101 RepID=UPI00218C5AF3|nr:GntR family transcriptional regulator [Vibrio sp. SCSIO 43136]USD64933.1 GntR family transcriptional regulator [Vibrio sp. SCSIO 43136]
MSSPTLADKVCKLIRKDILEGELAPSQKLVVAELKDKYQVGASPIREALVQLSWCKYVRLEPQKGCWVASISNHELWDLFDSLKVVSSHLLTKAIEHGDEASELELLSAFHKLSRIELAQEDYANVEWENRYQNFHHALFTGVQDTTMYGFFTDVSQQLMRYRFLALNSSQFTVENFMDVELHEKLMKAVLAKDVTLAQELLGHYLDMSRTKISHVLEAAPTLSEPVAFA